ncbi:MAG TPA: YebC/PmpR family DNA-binding transcriptional regulator [Spirochaetia bacterium]|nr:YebC/PmpR family DNA-binding transcriptional regulator [Spirochaetia bacterium]
MSGHSKWATIKRKKAKVDATRGKIFTRLAREIIVAAREGGGDPEANFRLKSAIARAKEANIPGENIARAIARGTGEGGGASFEEVVYEGYGPGGVAILVQALTDNKNRTAAEMRHMFSRHGGNLGEAGCVGWMFEPKGLLELDREGVSLEEDDLLLMALEAGAEDFRAEEDVFEVVTEPVALEAVREKLVGQGLAFAGELTMVPSATVTVEGKVAEQVVELLELLEEYDDVQNVYANADVNG